ncbi:3'(2'),5'-bisphosphate nucleotidase CysQ [Sulfitobacter sp. LCG007]
MPEDDLGLITDAIREAGKLALGYVGSAARRWDKPDNAGPVTEADIAVNNLLVQVLRQARPAYGWLSEESEDSRERLGRESVFIIDPIDGTRSFAEGSNSWAHSIAVARGGVVTAAAIYLPARDKLFTAAKGSGAHLNGIPISATCATDPDSAAVLATRAALDPCKWSRGVPRFRREHRPSLAYRLGLVAQGRFDAMLTFRPSWEWDIAAGALIVAEAGGTCSDATGQVLEFNRPMPCFEGVVAAGAGMHAALLAALAPRHGTAA